VYALSSESKHRPEQVRAQGVDDTKPAINARLLQGSN
jgi:hypothetical protein